jgi:hypothetical protein
MVKTIWNNRASYEAVAETEERQWLPLTAIWNSMDRIKVAGKQER